MQNQQQNPQKMFWEIIINVLLPVVILNRGGEYFGSTLSLGIALSLPLGYGIWDFVKIRRKNPFSILGFINILATGILAISGKEGLWFALKEALFPLLIGLFVLGTIFTSSPAMKWLYTHGLPLNHEAILSNLDEKKELLLQKLFIHSSVFLSLSFFFSALLNFILGIRIFTPLPIELEAEARSQLLNEQIAEMTWVSFIVIALPLTVLSMLIFWHFFNKLGKITGLDFKQLVKEP